MADDYEPPFPGYTAMDQEWRKNRPKDFALEETAPIPVDFFDDLGIAIVESHKKNPETLKLYLEKLAEAHTSHMGITGDIYQKDIATIFSGLGLLRLMGEISEFQGKWNKDMRAKIGKRVKVYVPFHDPKNGPPMIQPIYQGIEKAMRSR